MKYPNNDLWTVRQIELMDGALEEMKGKKARYFSELKYSLTIPNVGEYQFKGVLTFENDDRTVMFEYGAGFGVSRKEIIDYLNKYEIEYTEITD